MTKPQSNSPTDAEREAALAEIEAERIKKQEQDAKKRADLLVYVTRQVDHQAEKLDAYREKFNTATNLYHELQWYAGPAAHADILHSLWAEMQEHLQAGKATTAQILEHSREQVAERLLNNWVVEKSTNPVHNALSQAMADAYSEFHRQVQSMIKGGF